MRAFITGQEAGKSVENSVLFGVMTEPGNIDLRNSPCHAALKLQDEERLAKHRAYQQQWRDKNPKPRKPLQVCSACEHDLEPPQWAYLAGIFDGEGSVHLAPTSNRQGRLRTYQLCVTVVCGVQLEAIESIKVMLGQHGTLRPHGRKLEPINGKGSRRAAWRLRIWGLHAGWFLRGVRPYILMRVPQTDLALDFLAKTPGRGQRCSDEREASEAAAKAALTVMNQRGVQCAL